MNALEWTWFKFKKEVQEKVYKDQIFNNWEIRGFINQFSINHQNKYHP